MNKKIAVLFNGFALCYADTFAQICKKNNIQIDFYTFDNQPYNGQNADNVFCVGQKPNLKNVEQLKAFDKKFKEITKNQNYDYILSDCLPLSFTVNVFHSVSLGKRMQCAPFYLYRLIFMLGHFKRIMHERKFYTKSPKTIVVSSYLKNDYSINCNIPDESFEIIYPGMSIDNVEEPVSPPVYDETKPFVVGMNANGFTTKGGYVLLNALRILKKTNPSLNLKAKIIYPKFHKLSFVHLFIKLYGLEKMVEICPYQKDMKAFYRSLNCFICPSKYEAFGRVVIEAMYYKVPVIAGTNAGAVDIIEDGINGYVFKFNENSANNLAMKIKTVQKDYKEISTITENAYKTAKSITWEKFAENLYQDFYDKKNKPALV